MVDDSNNNKSVIIGYGGTGEVIRKYPDGSLWKTAYPESCGCYENVGRASGGDLRRVIE